MAPTLQAVAGGVDSNAYATNAQASAIFEGRPGASAWAAAPADEDQDGALIRSDGGD